MKLVIGNKNYSSWSLRAALTLALTDQPYQEQRIALSRADSREQLRAASPSGKVPVLYTEQGPVWDSLAIAEYLAERYPEAHLWPRGEYPRAFARSMRAELHSGLLGLRTHLPMDLKRRQPLAHLPEAAAQDVDRVCALWLACRQRFAQDGAFLFGHASIADAFFAPVAARFYSYCVALPAEAQAYVATIYQWPPFVRWYQAAMQETEIIE
jgi:glutathione S-transferase